MDTLMKRIGSFRDWKDTRFRPSELAKAGFYNSTQGNTASITCYYCETKVQARKFPAEGSLLDFHQLLAPNCASHPVEPGGASLAPPAPYSVSLPYGGLASAALSTRLPTQSVLPTATSCATPAATTVQALTRATRSLSVRASMQPAWADRRANGDHAFREFMFSEKHRLESYFDFPHKQSTTVVPERLSSAGLFYTGERDRVQCPFCGGKIASWENHDVPIVEHAKLYATCPFVQSTSRENIPIVPVQNTPPQSLGPHQEPMHRRYMRESERFTSFVGWPTSSHQTPQSMARAGLFYSGSSDQVTCFQCGGALRDWEPTDVPWTEHNRFYPTCLFVAQHLEEWRATEPPIASPAPSTPASQPRPFLSHTSPSASPTASLSVGSAQAAASGSSEEYQELQRRLEELQERRVCKICMDHDANISFVPCGHIACCSDCAGLVRECPICRSPVRDKMRVYMT